MLNPFTHSLNFAWGSNVPIFLRIVPEHETSHKKHLQTLNHNEVDFLQRTQIKTKKNQWNVTKFQNLYSIHSAKISIY